MTIPPALLERKHDYQYEKYDRVELLAIIDTHKTALRNADTQIRQASQMLANEQAKNGALVAKLVEIHNVMCAPDVKHPDGHWLQFDPPDELIKDAWRQLTNAIRSLDVPAINRDHEENCELLRHLGAFGAKCTCESSNRESG